MTETLIETQTLNLSEVKAQLSDLIDQISRESRRILIEEAGEPIAALIPASDLERLARFEQERAAHRQALETFGAAFANESLAEIEAQVERILTEGPQVEESEPQRKMA